MLPRLGRLPVLVALVAYLLTGAVSAQGLVLCIEADGHVKLEARAGGCGDCCPESGRPESGRLSSCSCLDVAIGSPNAPVQKPRPSDREQLAAWVHELPRPAAICRASRQGSSCASTRSPASTALAIVRSVVLLV